MTIKPIRSEKDLRAAFKRLDVIFQAPAGTPEAIKFRMEQQATPMCLNGELSYKK